MLDSFDICVYHTKLDSWYLIFILSLKKGTKFHLEVKAEIFPCEISALHYNATKCFHLKFKDFSFKNLHFMKMSKNDQVLKRESNPTLGLKIKMIFQLKNRSTLTSDKVSSSNTLSYSDFFDMSFRCKVSWRCRKMTSWNRCKII